MVGGRSSPRRDGHRVTDLLAELLQHPLELGRLEDVECDVLRTLLVGKASQLQIQHDRDVLHLLLVQVDVAGGTGDTDLLACEADEPDAPLELPLVPLQDPCELHRHDGTREVVHRALGDVVAVVVTANNYPLALLRGPGELADDIRRLRVWDDLALVHDLGLQRPPFGQPPHQGAKFEAYADS